MKKTILCILTLIFINNAFAWGPKGHRIVGAVASKEISLITSQHIKQILGNESLAQISLWADHIKIDPKYQHTSFWHYVNIPKGQTYKEIKKNKKGDLLQILKKVSKTLQNKGTSLKDKKAALSYIVHFSGDIHQPLHSGYLKDRGGNDILLKWNRVETNLHLVWDKLIIKSQGLSFTEYATFLTNKKNVYKMKWKKDKVINWHMESRELLDMIYAQKVKSSEEYLYVRKNIVIVNQRLLQAGIRLAALLDQIFLQKDLNKYFGY